MHFQEYFSIHPYLFEIQILTHVNSHMKLTAIFAAPELGCWWYSSSAVYHDKWCNFDGSWLGSVRD